MTIHADLGSRAFEGAAAIGVSGAPCHGQWEAHDNRAGGRTRAKSKTMCVRPPSPPEPCEQPATHSQTVCQGGRRGGGSWEVLEGGEGEGGGGF